MKVNKLIQIIILFLIVSCNKPSPEKGLTTVHKTIKELGVTKKNAKMYIPKLDHAFGAVIRGDTLNVNFPIYNNGTDTLTIDTAIVSCPCVHASLSKLLIDPGDSAELVIKYYTATKLGYDEKEITIIGSGFPKKSIIRVNANIHTKK